MDDKPQLNLLMVRVPEPPLEAWEKDALHKLRLLRQTGKPAILYLTETGVIQLFRAERAGVVTP